MSDSHLDAVEERLIPNREVEERHAEHVMTAPSHRRTSVASRPHGCTACQHRLCHYHSVPLG